MVARGKKWEEGARMGKTHSSNDLEEIERSVNIDFFLEFPYGLQRTNLR